LINAKSEALVGICLYNMNPLNLLGDLLTNHRPNFPIGTYEQATQRAARGRNVSVDRVVSLLSLPRDLPQEKSETA
jgi:hypothetical protein